jgi:RNA polymerase sigma factor (sigma-70 family)
MLESDAKTGHRDDFSRLMRPLLGFLREHARRELRILELEGLLNRGEVTVTDVLDEALCRAWEQFGDRPRKMPLHVWLTGLLHDVLEIWVKQSPRPHASLEEEFKSTSPQDVPQVGEQEWWMTLLGYDDTYTLEDFIPDSDGTPMLDDLDVQERKDWLLNLVRDLPRAQRQAFLLHALEDYDPSEIAMLQDRPENEVRADIEAAKQTLKKRLLARDLERKATTPAAV